MASGGFMDDRSSEETYDFVCTSCSKDDLIKEAVRYCVECQGYCCQSCTDIHRKFPTLEGHILLDTTDLTIPGVKSTLPDVPTERCSIHPTKLLDMYCGSCDVVACSLCAVIKHKFCGGIDPITEVIDTMFNKALFETTSDSLKAVIKELHALNRSADNQVKKLDRSKEKSLDVITSHRQEIETILDNIEQASRKEVERAFKKKKLEIIQRQLKITKFIHDLQTLDMKKEKSVRNKAQRLVCLLLVRQTINEVRKTDECLDKPRKDMLIFEPCNALRESILQFKNMGIPKFDNGMKNVKYKVNRIDNVNIELADDKCRVVALGSCVVDDESMVLSDFYNKKLKRVHIAKLCVVDYCKLTSKPIAVCCVNEREVAVACHDNLIQFVAVDEEMLPSRQIKTNHYCYGISHNGGNLYVTDNEHTLYKYSVNGSLLKTIVHDPLLSMLKHVAANERHVYLIAEESLICLNQSLNRVFTVEGPEKDLCGVCEDGRGNIFVTEDTSNNVVQISQTGIKLGAILNVADGIDEPTSVCFHKGLRRMFVTMDFVNIMKVYDLI